MTKNKKTLEDLKLDLSTLSKETITTLEFVINHYNHTGQCFHVINEGNVDESEDMDCKLCGCEIDEDDNTYNNYCSWNYEDDCDGTDYNFKTLSSLLLHNILRIYSLEKADGFIKK